MHKVSRISTAEEAGSVGLHQLHRRQWKRMTAGLWLSIYLNKAGSRRLSTYQSSSFDNFVSYIAGQVE